MIEKLINYGASCWNYCLLLMVDYFMLLLLLLSMYLAIDLQSVTVDLDWGFECLAIVYSDIVMVKSCSELLDAKLR